MDGMLYMDGAHCTKKGPKIIQRFKKQKHHRHQKPKSITSHYVHKKQMCVASLHVH